MSIRRPRVKAVANLGLKRCVPVLAKTANEKKEEIELKISTDKNVQLDSKEFINQNPEAAVNAIHPRQTLNSLVMQEQRPTTTFTVPELNMKQEKVDTLTSKTDVFKCPQATSSSRREESSPGELYQDNFALKHRQRIRPKPCFAYRRNSTQQSGNYSDNEDEIKTPKQINNSSVTPRPSGSSRIRTESSCSNASEQVTKDVRYRKSITSEEYQRIATAKKEFHNKFNGKTPDKCHLKMFDLIYYNPVTNPMKNCPKPEVQQNNPETEVVSNMEINETEDEQGSSAPVPQLKLGPNGEMILDEKSLVIETTGEKKARENLAKSSVLYLDENTGCNGFYKRKRRSKDWSAEETIKFYRCLHTVGTDFSLMLTLFPDRTRTDLKQKFKKEERSNMNLINKALKYPKTFDIEELKLELDKEEVERQSKVPETESAKKSIKKLREKLDKKKRALSRGENVLKDGDYLYDNEDVLMHPNGNESKSQKRKTNKRKKHEKKKIENHISSESLSFNCDSNNFSSDFNRELVEHLLSEIQKGSLVVVSSEDDSNNIINEVYVMCTKTGQLSEKPLNLPDEILNFLLN